MDNTNTVPNPWNNTNNQVQPPQTQNRPIYIDPNAGKSRMSKVWIWLLAGCGGCFVFVWLVFFAIASVIGALFSSGGVNLSEQLIKSGNSEDKIAIIPINGVLLDDIQDGDILNTGGYTTAGQINSLLKIASEDKNVKAIVLRENTPGGSALAARKVCAKIATLSKPVYTYIEAEGASAGYYIASCTKYIIADKLSITGSIGVVAEFWDIQGLLDKLGIKTKVVTNTQGTQKAGDIFEPNSKDEKKIKQLLDESYDEFLAQVVKGREDKKKDGQVLISPEKIKTLATGEIFSGKQAKELGLVDDNGMLDDAIKIIISREVLNSEIKVIQYNYANGWFAGLPSMVRSMFGINEIVPVSNSGVYYIRR